MRAAHTLYEIHVRSHKSLAGLMLLCCSKFSHSKQQFQIGLLVFFLKNIGTKQPENIYSEHVCRMCLLVITVAVASADRQPVGWSLACGIPSSLDFIIYTSIYSDDAMPPNRILHYIIVPAPAGRQIETHIYSTR
jgi:hypothetical protein